MVNDCFLKEERRTSLFAFSAYIFQLDFSCDLSLHLERISVKIKTQTKMKVLIMSVSVFKEVRG